MAKSTPTPNAQINVGETLAPFDDHAVAIAKRQYFQPGDNDLAGLFRRVATWVASPEGEAKEHYAKVFFSLMAGKRFCPGGRVLAGAATSHGNVLNCFVQDGSPETTASNAWVMRLATKLALVTKVGGGNGLNLDPLPPKRPYQKRAGQLFLTLSPEHPDYDKVKAGTYMDLVFGKYVTKGYRYAHFIGQDDIPDGLLAQPVGDSVESIWKHAGDAAFKLLEGEDVLLDLSNLRAEGTPVKGSGGTSSGPSSFAVEVFDNFAYWASLGGADYAGPVATLRYVYAPTLRVIRQGGTRRGAGMATMSITNPDIQDFITAKDLEREQSEGDISTFNISVLVSDNFMNQSKAEHMQGVLFDIADHAWQTGEPGLIFIDRINQFNPMQQAYGDIKATNPCLTGDTQILTSQGPAAFSELAKRGESVQVWCVDKRTGTLQLSTMVRPHKTKANAEVLRITFDSGLTVKATPDHHFFTLRLEKIAAKDLRAGQSIRAFQLPKTLLDTHARPIGNLHGTRQSPYRANQAGNHKVVSVEPAGQADVYNGMVDTHHTYLVVDPQTTTPGHVTGIVSANCGEIPLFPGEPCDLGAINLAQYVSAPDVGLEGFAWEGFREDVKHCIRFLDNVLEVNKFALPDNRDMSMKLRRLGLGIMGLADALIKMGYRYDSEEGRATAHSIISELRENATRASEELAEERDTFPAFADSGLDKPRRNVALLTVAPTGTTSMLMGVSSGVEPIFAPFIYRKIGSEYRALIAPLFKEMLERHAAHPDYAQDGNWDWQKVVQAVQDNHGSVQGLDFIPDEVKTVLVCAHDISPENHVKMQGIIQSAFDEGGEMVANSISKTINLPNKASVGDVYDAYNLAFETGCKGITVYRDGSRQFQVLSTKETKEEESQKGKEERGKPVQGAAEPSSSQSSDDKRSERLPGEPLFDRPSRVNGFTDNVKLTLPNGEKRSFYITVNKQDELPTEVFIISGKAGDEANADSEALGRMVSIALQYGVPAEAVIKTLRGINGGMYGSYQGRMVASKADLLAVALETAGVENVLNKGKSCPDCSAPLKFEEGCQKCDSCGYSKCG